ITPIKEWTCVNIVEYYRKEHIKRELSKILDSVKKDLIKVADANSDFDMTRKVKAQEIIDTWEGAGTLIEVLNSLGGAGTLSFTVVTSTHSRDWSSPVKEKKSKYNSTRISRKINMIRKKQQLSAIKNSVIQVDIFQNQFNEDSRKRSMESRDSDDDQSDDETLIVKKNKACEVSLLPSVEEISKITSTQDLIDRLRKTNIGLTDDDFKILNVHGITGRTFLLLTEEKLESRGVKLGPAMSIAYSVNKIREQKLSVNKPGADEVEDVSDTPPQAIIKSTFDQEKFREEIVSEVRAEICALIKTFKNDLRDLLANTQS
ncbi:13638_t:CDS:2, partial [Ambispora leptoticha]